ncbi:DUF2877 domain-containing protein [Virgibacillus sp. NKC19-3]|uniref:DUF2877 domain-containing protein n=1 Tax=Virgibacillus saliphilus TaxID=2831674 RepID=UPI001C9A9864|nr:DUF2877 domain-containing protein [Virgibacillus sp. NKC19-3]MBY7144193.1 DUF2877 domain-containing protein [Virgibacillus sp. NKC19-3]
MGTASLLGIEVDRILRENPKGITHSIFTNSFNLLFGDKIVHIGALENGIAPFGIGVDRFDVRQLIQQISLGQYVHWNRCDNRLFFFTSAMSLKLEQAQVSDNKLISSPFKLSILKTNAEYIVSFLERKAWQTGLAQSHEEKDILRDYLSSSSIVYSNQPILTNMKNVVALVQGNGSMDTDSVFDYWVGRGRGLTPSGDDMIIGVCAILSNLGGINKSFLTQLEFYLLRKGKQRTTQIGYEYLLYATRNNFHSHIKQLSQQLLDLENSNFITALEKVAGFGHTSGTDTLLGMLLGIKAVIYEPFLCD